MKVGVVEVHVTIDVPHRPDGDAVAMRGHPGPEVIHLVSNIYGSFYRVS